MNNSIFKKGISLILAIAMICSVFVTLTIPTSAEDGIYAGVATGYTSAGDVVYVKDGNYWTQMFVGK